MRRRIYFRSRFVARYLTRLLVVGFLEEEREVVEADGGREK